MDKGAKTAIDDCKILTKDSDMYSYSDTDTDTDSDCELEQHLDCKDGVRIDAAPFKTESKLVQMRYKAFAGGNKVLESDSKTLEMVKVFCEGRAKIMDDDYASEKFAQNKLNEFSSRFFQDYQTYAIQLITAGFELDIISLIDLMMPEVVNLFTTKFTEHEVYKFFFVNFKDYTEDKFNVMKQDLLNYREFLDFNFSDYRNSLFPNRDVRGT
ncbi:uncharacterized protein [Rutidosis leptorrhynchoides]|uniref:uncharacterized protein isoform X2 n=1 Tax=Rutidosis leptorrhynchoides TaxID=125765 RepID=UPI003A9A13ED